MIHVADGFYIRATDTCYTVCVKGSIGKDGKQYYDNISFYTDFVAAIDGVRRRVQRERLMGEDIIELSEALKVAESIEIEFKQIIEELTERVGEG